MVALLLPVKNVQDMQKAWFECWMSLAVMFKQKPPEPPPKKRVFKDGGACKGIRVQI